MYVLRHKWYVGLECWRYGLWWQGLIHDWQKLTPTEWSPYVESFYGAVPYSERPPALVAAFNQAWLHHIHHGKHHWQYWVLREDNGETFPLAMPHRYWQEMICDWIGAGRALGKYDPIDHYGEVRQWYLRNREKILLHADTRALVECELGINCG